MSVPRDPLMGEPTGLPTHPLMDESINLDDDSILSPQQEDTTAQSSPLAQLDAPEPPLTTDQEEGADVDGETARIMAEAKSMENILLETSPTLELGSDSVLTASSMVSASSVTSEEISTTSEVAPITDTAANVAETEEQAEGGNSEEAEKTEEVLSESSPSAQDHSMPQISSYFQSESTTNDPSSFFDSISPATASAQSPVGQEAESDAPPVVPGDHVSTTDIQLPAGEVHIRERTISMASEEATPVSFEEDKGSGLKYVGSMDSVNKFFSDTNASEVDVVGKGFFDSFTAGSTDVIEEQTSNVSPGQVEALSGPVVSTTTQPVSIPGSASNNIPPETPPIPHEPMSMSPLPSPIHTTFMRQRSVSQSQASPAPSPIHSTTQSTSEAPGTKENMPLETPESAPGLQNTFPSGDDLFTSGLSMSDADRRHDAWIPSELTRQSIVSMVTSAPGSYTLEPEQLTTPGITINDPFGDPVKELVQRFMGEVEANKRITLTAEDVTPDIEGLRKLISGECWRSAAELTGTLLEDLGQGFGKVGEITTHTSESLGIWFCRIALLVKMRLYSHAEAECQAFGNLDRPDLYYEYYPDLHPGRRGSMVPYSFRILHAELPQFLGKTQESLDRLYYVQAITKKIIGNLESGLAEDGSMLQLSDEARKASLDQWMLREVRLLYAIGNCLLSNKDYGMAVEVFEQLLKKDDTVNKDDLYCGIGRIYLQMGDIKTAQRHFAKAESNSDPTNPQIKCRNLMNKGFIALGQDLFSEAHNYFKQATFINPENAMAVNNMAVCSLYMGQLKEALNTLEVLVHLDPARYLQEGILFNLCTLYELESSRPLHKKQALLHLVSKHKGNGFNTACLKMT